MSLTRPVLIAFVSLFCAASCSTKKPAETNAPPDPAVTEPPPREPLIVKVAAGNGQVCLLRESGTVECWGDNIRGQLGQGHRDPVSGKIAVGGLGEVVSLEASAEGTCVLNRVGEVICWDTGPKVVESALTTVELGGPARLLKVDQARACASLSTGEVKCWELSKEDAEIESAGTIPVDATSFVALRPYEWMTCYVGSDRKMQCTRYPICPSPRTSVGCNAEPISLDGVVALDGSHEGLCAILDTGDVVCWGSFGGGRGPESVGIVKPQKLPGLKGATQISVTKAGACALTPEQVVCHPVPGYPSRKREYKLPEAGPWQSLALGDPSCALSKSGKVACWGSNEFGQFLKDVPSTGDRPSAVQGVAGATTLSMAKDAACTLDKEGSLRCWAGIWPTRGSATNLLPEHKGLVDVSVSSIDDESVGCAATKDGEVYCFGYTSNPGSPFLEGGQTQQLKFLSHVVDLEISISYGCLRQRDGRVKCWGITNTSAFDFGDHAKGDGYIPEFAGAVQLDVSDDLICALMESGEVRCWGDGDDWPDTPHKVKGLSQVVEFRTSLGSACARHKNGTVSCLYFGDLGSTGPDSDDNAFQLDEPRVVKGVSKAVSIAVGHQFACAALADGSVTCWGACRIDPGVRYTPTGDTCIQEPRKVKGLENIVEVRAIQNRYCALTKSGEVLCVGDVKNFLLEEATLDFSEPTLLPL